MLIQSVKVDLILLDVRLPGLDGIQLYDSLKADPSTSGIPVIFVTSSTNDADFRRRRFENVISKPFDLNTLLASVAALLRGKALGACRCVGLLLVIDLPSFYVISNHKWQDLSAESYDREGGRVRTHVHLAPGGVLPEV